MSSARTIASGGWRGRCNKACTLVISKPSRVHGVGAVPGGDCHLGVFVFPYPPLSAPDSRGTRRGPIKAKDSMLRTGAIPLTLLLALPPFALPAPDSPCRRAWRIWAQARKDSAEEPMVQRPLRRAALSATPSQTRPLRETATPPSRLRALQAKPEARYTGSSVCLLPSSGRPSLFFPPARESLALVLLGWRRWRRRHRFRCRFGLGGLLLALAKVMHVRGRRL